MSEVHSVLFVGSADVPVHLAGPPRQLTGRVRLRNPQSVTLVLRDAGVSDRSGRLVDAPTLRGFGPIVLRPTEERAVPLVVGVDPATPAGEYPVDLDVMGRVQRAILVVTEVVDVRVEPKRIVVTDNAGASWRGRILATNEGNVALSLTAIGPVDLRDDVTEVRDLRGVVAPLLAELPGKVDDLVAVLLAVLPPQGPVAGQLAIGIKGSPVLLAPGQTRVIDLEIDVPPALRANTRYRGRAAIATADLEFVVLTSARSGSDDALRSVPARRPRDGDSRPKRSQAKRKKEGGRR